MKYLERIGLVTAVNTILVAAIPYFAIFFKLSEDNKIRTEQIAYLSATVLISLITLYMSRKYLKDVARVEGFAWGYFYNFIYELSDLILDKDANIQLGAKQLITAKKDRQSGQPGDDAFKSEYLTEEIKILIIIPNDLHGEYRLSELISNIFEDAVITPSRNTFFPIRKKVMKGMEIYKEGKRMLLLIDTPPSTMRAMKLYQESCCCIDHNDAFEDLNPRSKKEFSKIYKKGCRNDAPKFKTALDNIIVSLTKGSKTKAYKHLITIITLDKLTSNIIHKDEYNRLHLIGDNISVQNQSEKQRLNSLISKRKVELVNKVKEIVTA